MEPLAGMLKGISPLAVERDCASNRQWRRAGTATSAVTIQITMPHAWQTNVLCRSISKCLRVSRHSGWPILPAQPCRSHLRKWKRAVDRRRHIRRQSCWKPNFNSRRERRSGRSRAERQLGIRCGGPLTGLPLMLRKGINALCNQCSSRTYSPP